MFNEGEHLIKAFCHIFEDMEPHRLFALPLYRLYNLNCLGVDDGLKFHKSVCTGKALSLQHNTRQSQPPILNITCVPLPDAVYL